jgi:hypothetical protein
MREFQTEAIQSYDVCKIQFITFSFSTIATVSGHCCLIHPARWQQEKVAPREMRDAAVHLVEANK